jgi:type I restriction enzyme, S subunit
MMSLTAKSSVDSVRMEMIADMQIPIPSVSEQKAIADILSDMDTELSALSAQRTKYLGVKQGMMTALLTGAIRLSEK